MKNLAIKLGNIYDTTNTIYECAQQHNTCECANKAAFITATLNNINDELPKNKRFLYTNTNKPTK